MQRYAVHCRRCDSEHRSRAELQNGYCRRCAWHVPPAALLSRKVRI